VTRQKSTLLFDLKNNQMAVLTVLCDVAKAESRIKAKPTIRTEPGSYANRANGLPLSTR
jgi:hypothetical protein